MEDFFRDAWGWLGKEIVEFGFRWLVVVILTAGFAVIGTLLFGRGYKKRIAALEARASMPAIHQTFNFNAGADAHDHEHQLRNAIEAKTVQDLRETIKRLPQHSLGDGHTYAKLPDGTNIVTMADGTMRLALPMRLSASFEGGLDGSLSASVTKDPPPEQDKPEEDS